MESNIANNYSNQNNFIENNFEISAISQTIKLKLQSNNTLIKIKAKEEFEDVNDVLSYTLEKFISDIKVNMNNCKFRKVLEEIRDKESKYSSCINKWQLNEFKLRCMNKIINRKYSKSTSPKNIEAWLLRIDITLENWLEELVAKHKSNQSDIVLNIEFDTFIRFTLEHCLNYANYAKFDKKIADCLVFLALGERLIKLILETTFNPETLNVISNILLMISSILIADMNYETAKLYQSTCLKVCLKELNLLTDEDDGINMSKLSKSEKHSVRKCVTNMVIAFYHRGVCEESIGELLKSIESYKQAKWFSKTFLSTSNPELAALIEDVESRAINYNKIIEIIKKIKVNDEDNPIKNFKLNFANSFFEDNKKQNNNNDVEILINKLKFDEIEDESILSKKKSEKVKFILSTIKLVDNLNSKNFDEMLKSQKEVFINKMNSRLKDHIQRKINEKKADEFNISTNVNRCNDKKKANETLDNKNQSENSFISSCVKLNYNNNNNDNENIISTSNKNESSNLNIIFLTNRNSDVKSNSKSKFKLYKSIINNKSNNGNENGNGNKKTKEIDKDSKFSLQDFENDSNNKSNLTVQINQTNNNSKSYNKNLYTKEKVKKYNFSKYISNKNYVKNKNYLNTVETKELKFQKDLLNSKLNEKLIITEFDPRKEDDKCKKFFSNVIINNKKLLMDDEKAQKKKELLLEESLKTDFKKAKLMNKVIRSLDIKNLDELHKFEEENEMNKTKKIKNSIRMMTANTEVLDSDSALRKNNEKENLIGLQLKNMEMSHIGLQKQFWPIKFKTKRSRKQYSESKTNKNFVRMKDYSNEESDENTSN